MRRIVSICAVILVACAKGDQPAADTTTPVAQTPPPPAPINLADAAGVWDVKTMPMDRDTVLATVEMTTTATREGWSLKFANGTKAAVRVLAVEGDSIVSEAGPFPSVVRKSGNATIHTITRLRDGKMVGVNHVKYANGDTTTLRLEGTKKAP